MNGTHDEQQQSDGLRPAPTARSHHRERDRERERERERRDSSRRHHNQAPIEPAFDIKQHPAAVSYAAAHPNRTIPKFGPYILLQTLGEGEFGKVKLGLHSYTAEEVAVKLIRRGSLENDVRMQKIRREIAVLESLHHPNIVQLYETIETDKYIGIILDYASGGELFDHILAHRYLREKDARKLFAQLISAVWYIHQKKIVHRDLKLENLLLDRNRNIIVTDFGFANRFEHKSDDLMQTSCGSPCYAAPELVISEGMYVGSAVDIWSCGVILYAMLAGYLPFDDDPENPEGDNIQQLYRYILNTPLTFPEHVSAEARDLLQKMLVPDPTQRATLKLVMDHPWLAPYSHLFEHSVDESETLSREMHEQKKLMYKKQMREREKEMLRQQRALQQTRERHQTHHIEPSTSSRDGRPQAGPYDTAPAQGDRSRRAVASAIVMPSSQPDDDHPMADVEPFAYTTPKDTLPVEAPRDRTTSTRSHSSRKGRPPTAENVSPTNVNGNGVPAAQAPAGGKSSKKAGGFRHTIQLEYDDGSEMRPDPPTPPRPSSRSQRANAEQRMELDMSNLDINASGQQEYEQAKYSPVAQQSPSRTSRRSSTTQRPPVPIPAVPAIPLGAATSFSPTGVVPSGRRGSNSSPVLLRNAATDPGPGYGEWETSESSTSAAITPLNSPPIDRDPMIAGSFPTMVTSPVSSNGAEKEKSIGKKQSEDKSRPASSSGRRHTRGISIDRIVGFGKLITGQGKESKDPLNANEQASSKKTKRSSSRVGRKNTEPAPPEPPVINPMASKTSVTSPTTEDSSTTVGAPPLPSEASTDVNTAPSIAPTTSSAAPSTTSNSAAGGASGATSADVSFSESTGGSTKSKRRGGKALSLMVDPISKMKEHRSKNRVSVGVGAHGHEHKEEEVKDEKKEGKKDRKAKGVSTPLSTGPEKVEGIAHGKSDTVHEKHSQAGWRLPLFRDTSQKGHARPPPAAPVAAMPLVTSPTDTYGVPPPAAVEHAAGLTGSQSMRVAPTAATIKSQGVMDWFRKKSLAKERRRAGSSAEPPLMPIPPGPVDADIMAYRENAEQERAKTPTQMDAQEEARTPTKATFRGGKQTPSVVITAAAEPTSSSNSHHESFGSSNTPSRMDRVVGVIKNVTSPLPAVPQTAGSQKHGRGTGASSGGSVGGSSSGGQSYSKAVLRLHEGPLDNGTLSSAPPQEVIAKVLDVLREMGIEYTKESEWKYRCVRPKKKKAGLGREPSGSGTIGHAAGSAMNGLDKRGLPMPSSTTFANAPGNMFKYIMRRSSSQAPPPPNFGANAPISFEEDAIDLGTPPLEMSTSTSGDAQHKEPIYGDKPDQHDEVRFSVEVTRLDRLDDILSLDIRRLKGNLKSYKFLYDIIRERCDLHR